eukprot:4036276-Alexandrium_andersonii.AAC.1
MSASLVGSEMCIRDRSATSGLQKPPIPKPQGPAVGDRRAGTLARAPPPVSYTHLTLPTICSV